MPNAQSEISELMALQHEAQDLRTKKANTPGSAANVATESDPGQHAARPEIHDSMHKLSENIESAVKEIHTVAKEKPVLTAVVAFTLGLIIGQFSSRR